MYYFMYKYIYMLHVFVYVKCYILKSNEENRLSFLKCFFGNISKEQLK